MYSDVSGPLMEDTDRGRIPNAERVMDSLICWCQDPNTKGYSRS